MRIRLLEFSIHIADDANQISRKFGLSLLLRRYTRISHLMRRDAMLAPRPEAGTNASNLATVEATQRRPDLAANPTIEPLKLDGRLGASRTGSAGSELGASL